MHFVLAFVYSNFALSDTATLNSLEELYITREVAGNSFPRVRNPRKVSVDIVTHRHTDTDTHIYMCVCVCV